MGPAEQLKGLQLGEWLVVEEAARRPNGTGGHFSKGYIVEHQDGRRGFLKALDYTVAMQQPNTAEVLLAMTQAYVFEKTLCEKCNHLSRIARAIGGGDIDVNPSLPFQKVEYLIFELADGDIRGHLDLQSTLDAVFIMKTLHHVAVGLKQLHTASIAHQDLKPSNVLVFGSGAESKICDLGRAWDKNSTAPHDSFSIAGDSTYAPPEFLYWAVPPDERARRFGCDLYHLGSLLVFCFTRVHTNALLFDNLSPAHRPGIWGGSYEDVLPFVLASFELVLNEFALRVPEFLRASLRQCASELCNPDPSERGHPKNRFISQWSLERYVSCFNRLASDAKLEVVRR
jgi:eukaryotic-like serine/threonine-protein kinase